jgi:hypothetical protein
MPIDYIIVFILSFTTVVCIIIKVINDDNKKKGNNDDGGDYDRFDSPPQIDLPPGVCWPDDAPRKEREKLIL